MTYHATFSIMCFHQLAYSNGKGGLAQIIAE